jgi:hypothetical protein
MRRDRATACLAICLALGGCAQEEPEPEASTAPAITAQASADPMQEDSLGPVHYAYDTGVLTRAEISLPLPPDFEESVFAVKFIPTQLLENLGDPNCSYEHEADDSECTAEQEIGFALAFLERPIETYGEALVDRMDESMTMAPATVQGHEGFTLETPRGGTVLHYTFLPVAGRTLLLVERNQADIQVGAEALAQVRESLRFPDD